MNGALCDASLYRVNRSSHGSSKAFASIVRFDADVFGNVVGDIIYDLQSFASCRRIRFLNRTKLHEKTNRNAQAMTNKDEMLKLFIISPMQRENSKASRTFAINY